MQVYFLPGLGFDHRIFSRLDLPGVTPVYLNWIAPVKGENLSGYAARLGAEIDDRKGPVALVGHSMGGMAALELTRHKRMSKVVLLSSIRSRAELPGQFRVVKPLGLQVLFTRGMACRTVGMWGKRHDYVTAEEQDLFRSMVGQQSNAYLRWALKTLSGWPGVAVPAETGIFQIHGAGDRTFPVGRLARPDRVVEGAGHFMVYRRAAEVSGLVMEGLTANNFSEKTG